MNYVVDVGSPSKSVEELQTLCRSFLVLIGEDPDREGLQDTPRRWARMWAEFVDFDAGKVDTAFEAVETDQMVAVTGVRVYSVCEHHLLPFWCDLTIAYLADRKILGVSKLIRIASQHAHKLQLQERLCAQIANDVSKHADTRNVAVIAKGTHLCMAMRGVKAESAAMVTSVMRGVFLANPAARSELLSLIGTFERRW